MRCKKACGHSPVQVRQVRLGAGKGREAAEVLPRVRNLIKQVTGSVRWRESVNWMIEQGVDEFFELGAGKVLSGIIKRSHKNVNAISVGSATEIEELAKMLNN